MNFTDLKGTTNSYFQIQKNGPRLKNNSGEIQARNAADSLFADLYGKILKAAADSLILNNDAASAGADWKYTVARPAAGMTGALTITFPPNYGTSGQVLTTDGSGNLTWTTLTVTGVMMVQSVTLPYTMFTGGTANWFMLPANGCIDQAKFIVDTEFLGGTAAPFASIGNLGFLGKYAPSTLMKGISAGETYDPTINNVPLGVPEQITYSAGSSGFGLTQGSVRLVVEYY